MSNLNLNLIHQKIIARQLEIRTTEAHLQTIIRLANRVVTLPGRYALASEARGKKEFYSWKVSY